MGEELEKFVLDGLADVAIGLNTIAQALEMSPNQEDEELQKVILFFLQSTARSLLLNLGCDAGKPIAVGGAGLKAGSKLDTVRRSPFGPAVQAKLFLE